MCYSYINSRKMLNIVEVSILYDVEAQDSLCQIHYAKTDAFSSIYIRVSHFQSPKATRSFSNLTL